jgi:tRNA pseudouridine38-40 synthase
MRFQTIPYICGDMQRFFIYLAYDGGAYHGWQIQPNGVSVQAVLTAALTIVLRRETAIVGAGRTDSGVHARQMVAHFDSEAPLDTVSLRAKLNRLLPPDVAIADIRPVGADAHARFDALSRTYHYYISESKQPLRRAYCWRVYRPLDYDRMNEAAATLTEYTDFTSFSKLHTDVKTNNCRVVHAQWTLDAPDVHVFTITADRFLRNMVRAIVGTLVEVGVGKMSVADFRAIIERRDRSAAGMSAPAQGLFLDEIVYPDELFVV